MAGSVSPASAATVTGCGAFREVAGRAGAIQGRSCGVRRWGRPAPAWTPPTEGSVKPTLEIGTAAGLHTTRQRKCLRALDYERLVTLNWQVLRFSRDFTTNGPEWTPPGLASGQSLTRN